MCLNRAAFFAPSIVRGAQKQEKHVESIDVSTIELMYISSWKARHWENEYGNIKEMRYAHQSL